MFGKLNKVSKKAREILFCLVAIMALVGCATVPRGTGDVAANDLQKRRLLVQQRRWVLTGVVSYTSGLKRDQADFCWWQEGDNYNITITAPLHLGQVKINGNSFLAQSCHGEGQCSSLMAPEQLLATRLTVKIPLTSLPYWLFAVPLPRTKAVIRKDGQGGLAVLKQNGWEVEYLEYQERGGYVLPSLLSLQHGKEMLKIRVKSFNK